MTSDLVRHLAPYILVLFGFCTGVAFGAAAASSGHSCAERVQP